MGTIFGRSLFLLPLQTPAVLAEMFVFSLSSSRHVLWWYHVYFVSTEFAITAVFDVDL
jgi:hypothetical protein